MEGKYCCPSLANVTLPNSDEAVTMLQGRAQKHCLNLRRLYNATAACPGTQANRQAEERFKGFSNRQVNTYRQKKKGKKKKDRPLLIELVYFLVGTRGARKERGLGVICLRLERWYTAKTAF